MVVSMTKKLAVFKVSSRDLFRGARLPLLLLFILKAPINYPKEYAHAISCKSIPSSSPHRIHRLPIAKLLSSSRRCRAEWNFDIPSAIDNFVLTMTLRSPGIWFCGQPVSKSSRTYQLRRILSITLSVCMCNYRVDIELLSNNRIGLTLYWICCRERLERAIRDR